VKQFEKKVLPIKDVLILSLIIIPSFFSERTSLLFFLCVLFVTYLSYKGYKLYRKMKLPPEAKELLLLIDLLEIRLLREGHFSGDSILLVDEVLLTLKKEVEKEWLRRNLDEYIYKVNNNENFQHKFIYDYIVKTIFRRLEVQDWCSGYGNYLSHYGKSHQELLVQLLDDSTRKNVYTEDEASSLLDDFKRIAADKVAP